jgi:hypothetical protein
VVWLTVMLCASRVVITEVMANPKGSTGAHGPEDRNEFVELYNPTGRSVDLYDWTLDDGDSKDRIIAWRDSSIRAHDTTLLVGTTWLLPNHYAVIIDSEYTDPNPVGGHEQPYHFGESTLILTTANTTLGNGLAGTDFIIIASPYGDTTTFGTPADTFDSLPRDAGDGISWERVRADCPDSDGNWAPCPDTAGCTPGRDNAVAGFCDLAAAGIAVGDSLVPEHPFSFSCRVANRGFVAAVGTVRVWLDRNGNLLPEAGEVVAEIAGLALPAQAETAVALTATCPSVRTDLWLGVESRADRDSLNNRCRVSLTPGRSGRCLDLPLNSFSPDADGLEDVLPVVFRLPDADGTLTVTVFDLAGRVVKTLHSGRPTSDQGTLCWNGSDARFRRAPPGVYAVALEYRTSGTRISEKVPIVLLRK